MKRLLLVLLVLVVAGCSTMAPVDLSQQPIDADANYEHIEVFAEVNPG
jgi:hypothetical protein